MKNKSTMSKIRALAAWSALSVRKEKLQGATRKQIADRRGVSVARVAQMEATAGRWTRKLEAVVDGKRQIILHKTRDEELTLISRILNLNNSEFDRVVSASERIQVLLNGRVLGFMEQNPEYVP